MTAFTYTLGTTRYAFGSLRELLAKASPARSGDYLAGIAAQSATECVAARRCAAQTVSPRTRDSL